MKMIICKFLGFPEGSKFVINKLRKYIKYGLASKMLINLAKTP